MIPPHPAPRIRQATITDLESLVNFNTALAWETEGRRLNKLTLEAGTKTLLENSQRGFYVVAAVETPTSMIIGQLMITYEWSDWRNGEFWWIQSVYVHPDWRRQGIFHQLYAYILDKIKDKPQVAGIRLYVEQTNKTAQTAYTHLGLVQAPYHIFEQDFVLPSPIP